VGGTKESRGRYEGWKRCGYHPSLLPNMTLLELCGADAQDSPS